MVSKLWCMCTKLKSVRRDGNSTCSICGGRDAYGTSKDRPFHNQKVVTKKDVETCAVCGGEMSTQYTHHCTPVLKARIAELTEAKDLRVMNEEEQALAEVIRAARKIQKFLWGENNAVWDLEEWKRMFRKRVAKLDEVDRENPHASVEIKKRLLQTAALAVAMIGRIDREGLPPETCDIPSNLKIHETGTMAWRKNLMRMYLDDRNEKALKILISDMGQIMDAEEWGLGDMNAREILSSSLDLLHREAETKE